ncbi:MAG: outer membrane beta-barrel domain-containing protein [Myxococcota bacterium]|jgi:outer membrane beta-barrel protein|nr:outer membrane beta-barrel domain-containing protein [Myxococcota bacterium]
MRLTLALTLLLASWAPGVVLAQEALAPSASMATVDAGPSEAEIQETWGEKRVIRTLQKRLFAKFARLEFTGFLGIVPNDPFVFYMPIGLRVDYHFNEAFALEFASSFLGCFTGDVSGDQERGIEQGCLRIASDLKNELISEKGERTRINTITLLDQQVARFGLAAMWSPFFGKVAVMNDSLVHFDVNLVGGAGLVVLESINPDTLRDVAFDFSFEGVLGAGFKFYFGERYGIRADFRQYIYQKQRGSGTASPSEISLGFSVFTN